MLRSTECPQVFACLDLLPENVESMGMALKNACLCVHSNLECER
jgi:hypothetical protein